jgi:hypothetical protein
MKPENLRIYLETTLFNFYFDTHPVNAAKRQAVHRLFEKIRQGKYAAYTSFSVTEELSLAEEPKRNNMENLLEEYGIKRLAPATEADKLAGIYLSQKIIPKKYDADARHIAITTVYGLDYIVSYDFEHIVKDKTIYLTMTVNMREGYRPIGIVKPEEEEDAFFQAESRAGSYALEKGIIEEK